MSYFHTHFLIAAMDITPGVSKKKKKVMETDFIIIFFGKNRVNWLVIINIL